MKQDSFHRLFLQSLKGPFVDLLELREEAGVSLQLDLIPIQDSFCYRARHLGLRLATLLINEKGELERDLLERIDTYLEEASFIIGPNRESDVLIYKHIRNCLHSLRQNPHIWSAIHKISSPLCHKRAEEVIRETLWPEPIRTVQTVHIRKAVLAAWFTYLRQTTGSCFATAPAILIQQQDPLRFFKDLHDLLSTGQLKRVFGGKEFSVPLSLNTGMGDLRKLALGCERSLGIAVALGAAGVKLTEEVYQKIGQLGPVTVESLFSALLLQQEGLTLGDIEEEEQLARLQMTPLIARSGAVFYQKPSERAQKIANWKKNVVKACTAFKTITECALLRVWEYSIASFSDLKTEFTRWNLYIGLGLHPEQKEGIGALLYREISERLEACNWKIDQLTKEYQEALATLQILEEGIRGALSEARRNQLKSDWTTYQLLLDRLGEERNELLEHSDALVKWFPSLIEQYDQKLQEYFQEFFDPALQGEEGQIYADSLAGFRLVYKHGRMDASQWSSIHNREQYVEYLRDFFSRTERDLQAPPHIEPEVLTAITTALIQFIQRPEFVEASIARSKEKGRKSPWDYISGGTLQTLLMAYCNRNTSFTERSLIPHSAEELFRFLSSIKSESPLLMHSPTHAFIFYPSLLQEGPLKLQKGGWNEEEQNHVALRLSDRLPEEEKALFIHLFRQKQTAANNFQFRTRLIESLSPRVGQKEALVDAVLYENWPLFSLNQAEGAANQILRALNQKEIGKELEGSFFGPLDLYQIVKSALLKSMGSAISSMDWDEKIGETMRKFGFISQSCLFGDTNWSSWFFGFVVSPITGQLELWRLNRTRIQGYPMVDWNQWLDEKNTSPWVILTRSEEYS